MDGLLARQKALAHRLQALEARYDMPLSISFSARLLTPLSAMFCVNRLTALSFPTPVIGSVVDVKSERPAPAVADVKAVPSTAKPAAIASASASGGAAAGSSGSGGDVSGPLPAVCKAMPPGKGDSAVTTKLVALCNQLKLATCEFRRVPSSYYDWPLEHRRHCLEAVSVHQLCKTIIMTNTKWEPQLSTAYSGDAKAAVTKPGKGSTEVDVREYRDVSYSRYYAIIVQYSAKLNKEKLIKLTRGLRSGAANTPAVVSKKKFNYRLAEEQINDLLSGYAHNAVCPLGMRHEIPIIMSDRALEANLKLPYIWLGGGEVDVKWKVSPAELCTKMKVIVGDITYADGESESTAGGGGEGGDN